MAEHGVEIKRVINAGGIPQKNNVLNQIYADVLGRPVLVPSKSVVSLGSAIFAFLAAGTFKTVEEAQDKICPGHTVFKPQPAAQKTYDPLCGLYKRLYFAFGQPDAAFGDVLPALIKSAETVNSTTENAVG
jgi:L-ribulokinase